MKTETNYELIETEGSAPIKSWTKGVLFEEHAKAQLRAMATMPIVVCLTNATVSIDEH